MQFNVGTCAPKPLKRENQIQNQIQKQTKTKRYKKNPNAIYTPLFIFRIYSMYGFGHNGCLLINTSTDVLCFYKFTTPWK